MTLRVRVEGAGVAGLAVALELARHGHAVAVVERRGGIGLGASHWAGGMLAPDCEGETAEEIVVRLGRQAAAWWEAAVPGIVLRHGTLVVAHARDRADLRRFAARTGGHAWLDGAGIDALEPDLAGRFGAGLLFAAEAHLDPRKALQGLFEAAKARGVTFHFGGDVPEEVVPEEAGPDLVIDCRGPQAIGAISGLRGVRGEMMILETADVTLSRPVRLLHPRHPIYIVPRGAGRFMLGATMIETEDDGPISARSTMELLNTAYALHPAFGEARILETGTGIRPAFADNVPRIVKTPTGLALAGLHRHGFLLAPAFALSLAERLGALQPQQERRRA